jgi:hypothetical protein
MTLMMVVIIDDDDQLFDQHQLQLKDIYEYHIDLATANLIECTLKKTKTKNNNRTNKSIILRNDVELVKVNIVDVVHVVKN